MILRMDVIVELTKQAKKDLAKVLDYIAEKARLWIEEVREDGLEKAQANTKWVDEFKTANFTDFEPYGLTVSIDCFTRSQEVAQF
jgi:ribosome recycling factor